MSRIWTRASAGGDCRYPQAAFGAEPDPGIVIIYLKAALCASLTLLLSTFASSWIFTIMVSVMFYFIGHVQPIAREAWLGDGASFSGEKILLVVALALPGSAAFNLVDDIVVGNVVPTMMFVKTAGLGC